MKTKGLVLAACCLLCSLGLSASKIKGNGTIITKTIAVETFDAVEIGRGIAYQSSGFGYEPKEKPVFRYAQNSGKSSLTITTDENIFSLLKISSSDGKLTIKSQGDDKLYPTQLNIQAASGKLKNVALSGAINFIMETPFQGDHLKIAVSGAGDIKMAKKVQLTNFEAAISGAGDLQADDLSCDRFTASISGAGDMQLSGKSRETKISVSGAGDVDAYEFESQEVSVSVSGAGNVHIYASDNLDASVSGIGSIRYKGNPVTRLKKSGMGSIKQAD
jgi:hypothetical protein